MGYSATRKLSQHENQFVDSISIYTPGWERGIVRGKCPALEHISIRGNKCHKEIDRGWGKGVGGGGGEASSYLWSRRFSVFYDRPSKNICQSLENCIEHACSKFYGSCAALIQPPNVSLIYLPTVQRCLTWAYIKVKTASALQRR